MTTPNVPKKVSEKDRQPTLKVMRLYKGKFHLNSDYPQDPMVVSCHDTSKFALSSNILLPDSFGNIHLGETFSSYISVINHFSYNLYNVGLSVIIQNGQDRVELNDVRKERSGTDVPANPIAVFQSGQNLDMVVVHKLVEKGVHTLRVGVSYTETPDGAPESLRKFYRFTVLSPIEIVPIHHTIGPDPYVQISFKNMTQAPIFIGQIEFHVQSPFCVVQDDESEPVDTIVAEDLFDDIIESSLHPVLNPDEILQKVYHIQHQDGVPIQGTVTFGRVGIEWYTALGEAGSIESNSISRKMTGMHDVEVVALELPDQIPIGVPYEAKMKITNHSQTEMDLQLQLRKDDMKGLFCSSVSLINIGTLRQTESKTVSVELLPLLVGLLQLHGVFIIDRLTRREYEFNNVVNILGANK